MSLQALVAREGVFWNPRMLRADIFSQEIKELTLLPLPITKDMALSGLWFVSES